jgi:hypothetical protein
MKILLVTMFLIGLFYILKYIYYFVIVIVYACVKTYKHKQHALKSNYTDDEIWQWFRKRRKQDEARKLSENE